MDQWMHNELSRVWLNDPNKSPCCHPRGSVGFAAFSSSPLSLWLPITFVSLLNSTFSFQPFVLPFFLTDIQEFSVPFVGSM